MPAPFVSPIVQAFGGKERGDGEKKKKGKTAIFPSFSFVSDRRRCGGKGGRKEKKKKKRTLAPFFLNI